MYVGSRVVSADITTLRGAGARVDAVASSFAPYMVPSARPVLHYILDRPGAAERTLTLRASGYQWPIVGPDQRDIQLQFVAADPIPRDANQQTATAWSGSSTTQGRTYNLVPNRIYPPGGSSGSNAYIYSYGDVPIHPRLLIYGPVTNPGVTFYIYRAATGPPDSIPSRVLFTGGLIVSAGHFIDVDTARKTAYMDSDPNQSVLPYVDWTNTRWPQLPVVPGYSLMGMSGTSTSGITQTQCTWRDGFLT